MDVSVVSARTNLSVNAYRQLENGTIKMAKIRNFSEIATKKRGNTPQNIPVGKEKTFTNILSMTTRPYTVTHFPANF
jgi:hypothetical protein